MAEAPPVVDKGLEGLEKEVTCPVCHDFFHEPKILPCCHYYCKECIDALANRVGPNNPFLCPECRVPTLLPSNDSNQLPTAFFLNRIKELHGKMEKAHGKTEAKCEQCRGGNAVAFCRQCTEFICDDCVKSHQKLKVFSGHKVVTLEELKEGGAKDILVTKPPPPNCTIHDEPMKAYCFDCSRLICRDCIVINHAGHKSEFTKVTAPETKKLLAEHLAPLRETQASLCNAAEAVQVVKSEVVAQGATIAENIEHSFQKLQEILEQHKRRLLAEASEKVEEKVTKLTTQEKQVNTASAVIQSLVDFVEQNFENATDEELMMIHKQMLSRIDKEAEEHHKGAIDLDPVEEADIVAEIDVAESLNDICRKKAKISSHPVEPSKCTVEGPGLNSTEVNQQSHVIVRTMLHNGAPTKKPQTVTAELKSVVNGSVIRLEGVQKEGNTYEIQFTPAVRGRHHLTVNVNNQPIAGSPFPLYTATPHLHLGKPVRVISGLDRPYGVTINSTEEVLVTERKSIAVFNKKGTKLREINLLTDDFDLTGIAVDDEQNIYVTDCKHDSFMKLNKAGELLKTVGKHGQAQDDFNEPRGVAVVEDQVFVSDQANNQVKVFSKELKLLKTVGGSQGQGNKQFNQPSDITQDEQGNVYICDYGNNRIQVINNRGEFQRSFSKKANGQLSFPSGVCVVDQFVYVVEYVGYCVSVFSRDGQFVTSFGKRGNKEGEFVYPFGVCVDYDGFVYVCDYSNNRVQVF